MNFVVWDKEKLNSLSIAEKELWFDVLNNGLEEDRGYSLKDPNIEEIKKEIKSDYFSYLHEITRTSNFVSYFILYEDEIIVCVCRVVEIDKMFYLEGLETHRNYLRKRYATILINHVIDYLKELDVIKLRSNVSMYNEKSILFHKSIGFKLYDQVDNKLKFEYKIMNSPRYYRTFSPFFIIPILKGVPYHEDNNNRYYKPIMDYQIINLIMLIIVMDVILYITNANNLTVILVHIAAILFCNLSNFIRLFYVKNLRYKRITAKYTFTNIIILLLSFLIMNIII